MLEELEGWREMWPVALPIRRGLPVVSHPVTRPDEWISVPYYREAVALLLEHKEEIKARFKLTLFQVYMTIVSSALAQGRSPNLLARALVGRLGQGASE